MCVCACVCVCVCVCILYFTMMQSCCVVCCLAVVWCAIGYIGYKHCWLLVDSVRDQPEGELYGAKMCRMALELQLPESVVSGHCTAHSYHFIPILSWVSNMSCIPHAPMRCSHHAGWWFLALFVVDCSGLWTSYMELVLKGTSPLTTCFVP